MINHKHYSFFKISYVAFFILGYCNNSLAETEKLEEISVVSSNEESKKPNVTQKNRATIQQELISNNQDLVRYTTDIGINDNGRHSKGFAMRGVEGNRVGISIDGVSLPDAEENSLYARYGNFNNSRLTIDPELIQGIDIVKGGDSFNSGSGYLGGGVNYRTLGAVDLVSPDNKFGGMLKNSYSSKNKEWVHTGGLAYKGEQLEAILLYSRRNGHELESLGRGEDINGPDRGIPDPSKHRNHSYLAKLSYLFNDKHRLNISFNRQKNKNIVDERSYSLLPSNWREAHDISERNNLNIGYEYFPTESKLLYAKLEYDWQKTDVGAISYKGGRNWFTNEKVLDEIYDRRMKTEFHRISTRFDSIPLELDWGIHNVSLRTALSKRTFENINQDTYIFSGKPEPQPQSSIQRPVRTDTASISLEDKIKWNTSYSTNLGVRYDYSKLKPQPATAICHQCQSNEKPSTFKGLSVMGSITRHLDNNWNVGYSLSTGFRIPSASEIYFTYKHPAGTWLANPDLKAERSINHSLFLNTNNHVGNVNFLLYRNNYKNFLVEQETAVIEKLGYGGQRMQLYQQMQNIDKAHITGIEISGKLNLNEITPLSKGWKLFGSIGYSKGKLATDNSLLSIQPAKFILGLDYEDPNEHWGVFSRFTYQMGKKAKDAKITKFKDKCIKYEIKQYPWGEEYKQCVDRIVEKSQVDYPYLNKSYALFDIYGYLKIREHIILRAGIYNIFDKKYQTWDALRGINRHSTTNSVDREGKGLERFYAPGRNFSLSAEIRF